MLLDLRSCNHASLSSNGLPKWVVYQCSICCNYWEVEKYNLSNYPHLRSFSFSPGLWLILSCFVTGLGRRMRVSVVLHQSGACYAPKHGGVVVTCVATCLRTGRPRGINCNRGSSVREDPGGACSRHEPVDLTRSQSLKWSCLSGPLLKADTASEGCGALKVARAGIWTMECISDGRGQASASMPT